MIAGQQPICSTGSPSERHMLLRRLRWRPLNPAARPPLQAWTAVPSGRRGAATAATAAAAAAAPAKGKRGKKGAASEPSSDETPAAASPAFSPPASAAIDLQRYAPRWGLEPAELPQQWLTFSDLHVSKNTRATCMAVLEQVHEEAVRRNAGILFLGKPCGGAAGW